jgi:predicted RNase H-like nuclease (RuvC/YqgF family)
MNPLEHMALEELDRDDRRRTRRERWLAASVLGIGVVVAMLTAYEVTSIDNDVRSIRCEQGDVVLILERSGGGSERVECPAGASVKP